MKISYAWIQDSGKFTIPRDSLTVHPNNNNNFKAFIYLVIGWLQSKELSSSNCHHLNGFVGVIDIYYLFE
jgi:hypothetical protein